MQPVKVRSKDDPVKIRSEENDPASEGKIRKRRFSQWR